MARCRKQRAAVERQSAIRCQSETGAFVEQRNRVDGVLRAGKYPSALQVGKQSLALVHGVGPHARPSMSCASQPVEPAPASSAVTCGGGPDMLDPPPQASAIAAASTPAVPSTSYGCTGVTCGASCS